jgi:hypothetical protein
MSDIVQDSKIRNWLADDAQNRDWAKLLLRLRDGKKALQFITNEEGQVIPIGGPGAGGGGASAGGGALPAARYTEDDDSLSKLKDSDDFIIRDAILSSSPYSDSGIFSAEDRVAVKDEIVTKLSETSGVDYNTTNEIIKRWAASSNDDDVNSLAIQQEAAKMFGSSLSEWQQSKIDTMERGMESIVRRDGKLVTVPGKLEPNIATRPEIRRVLNAMYDHTQAELANAGFPEYVTLRRGVGGAVFKEGSVQQVYQNALSSFTSNVSIAHSFAFDTRGGVVIEIQVPRSRILATARTGFGCLNEYEFVLIGNNRGRGDQVKIVEVREKY